MRLTAFSDYGLRLLLYAAAHRDRLITIEEAATAYGISRAHLMKVAASLTRAGFLAPVRGRGGGLRLGKEPGDITVDRVVRACEPDFELLECFSSDSRCLIAGCCRLPNVFTQALDAFLATLRTHTLADVMLRPNAFVRPAGRAGRRSRRLRPS